MTTILQSQLRQTIESSLLYFYQSIASVMNLIFCLIALTYTVYKPLIFIYTLVLGAYLVLRKWMEKNLLKAATIDQTNSIRLGEHLQSISQHIFLKSEPFISNWINLFHKQISAFVNGQINKEKVIQINAIMSSLFLFIPFVFMVLHLFYKAETNFATVILVALNLPRMIQLVNSTYQTLISLTHFQSQNLLFNQLASKIFKKESTVGFINKEKLTIIDSFNRENQFSVDQFEAQMPDSGRYLISGKNGAGKTTYLLKKKEKWPDAVYLPPNTFFITDENLSSQLSTGQMHLKYLDIILKNAPQILLLDEWSANLDTEVRSQISAKLDQLAQKSLILEVSHVS